MTKTYLYIPDELDVRINDAVKAQKTSKAEILRKALGEGLTVLEGRKSGGAELLVQLAQIAKKNQVKGPKDLSSNLDYYLWGGEKKGKE